MFRRKIQKELDEMQAWIARLRAQTDQASADTWVKMQQMIVDLEKRRRKRRASGWKP